MVEISLCMIVKNEEENLSVCLDCLKDICEEIIIVDTGSTDSTKSIAKEYTDKIYDFTWMGDFSEARNFAFSKATKEYIYSADADEFIDEENIEKFKALKEVLIPEVEIVQMIYLENGIRTVLNSNSELRPKLYRKTRNFVWIDPVHERARTLPVVYDSDIVIEHRPKTVHASRDFKLIERAYTKQGTLSKNLYEMYAREVYRWGEAEDLARADDIFTRVMNSEVIEEELYAKLSLVCAKSARVNKDIPSFIKHTSKVLGICFCQEICSELGDYFASVGDDKEAEFWRYNKDNEAKPILSVK